MIQMEHDTDVSNPSVHSLLVCRLTDSKMDTRHWPDWNHMVLNTESQWAIGHGIGVFQMRLPSRYILVSGGLVKVKRSSNEPSRFSKNIPNLREVTVTGDSTEIPPWLTRVKDSRESLPRLTSNQSLLVEGAVPHVPWCDRPLCRMQEAFIPLTHKSTIICPN